MAKWCGGLLFLLGLLAPTALVSFSEDQDRGSKPVPEDIPALRMVADPFPALNGIAVDPENHLVVASDPNRKSLLLYDKFPPAESSAATTPARQIVGPNTYLGMVAGVLVDPEHHEMLTANNDIEDTVVVMPYGANGNANPARVLSVPHQAWGLALGRKRDELAVSVEIFNAVVFYRREAHGVEAPVRVIRGPKTGMADPHGIAWDDQHDEIAVANHGNFRGLYRNNGAGCVPVEPDDKESDTVEIGMFRPPSISVFSADAKGDTAPLRVIQGPKTQLDWPMGIAVDAARNEIAVANNGDSSILIFDRKAAGDASPVRVIRGAHTGIDHPMGISVDSVSGDIWVSNYGNHSALAFAHGASGDAIPKHVIRSAPKGTPTPGFGNPMAVAYDCKRGEILVPN